jgi:hypothetical protein
MMKYHVITGGNVNSFVDAIKNAISYGWAPSGSPVVNSETNCWIIIMCKETDVKGN